MSAPINSNKIVIFTGAGISAESGIPTFRDFDGLWNTYDIEELATKAAWENNPELVLEFYNQRKKKMAMAQPNAAHLAVAELERKYTVVVITQNVDDLHEKAGSSRVIHLHGEMNKARSSVDENLIYPLEDSDAEINIGDKCEHGSQLRPHIVLFDEEVQNYALAVQNFKDAGRVLVIGTSLSVEPAAELVNKGRHHAEKVIVTKDIARKPRGYELLKGNAASLVPYVANCWLKGQKVRS